MLRATLLILLLLAALPSSHAATSATPAEDAPYVLLEDAALEDLVAPVALYPDDLLGIVLPAATYPLQIVQASRFIETRKETERPPETWDETVVALTNYPEALALLNKDLDWTWQLGEAVLYQEEDVLRAVANFRERARLAGNLESDEHQRVVKEGEHIVIKPAEEDAVYVPYYDPEQVTTVRTRRVVHYYPTAYPVYYYPYSHGYSFPSDYFWGVSTFYGIGWAGWRLHNLHHGYRFHPFYGQRYRHHHYRHPRYTRTYGHSNRRFHDGNAWRPRYRHTGIRPGHRAARNRYDAGPRYRHDDHRYRDGSHGYDRYRQERAQRHREQRRADNNRPVTSAEARRRTQAPRSENRVGRDRRDVNAALARGRMEAPSGDRIRAGTGGRTAARVERRPNAALQARPARRAEPNTRRAAAPRSDASQRLSGTPRPAARTPRANRETPRAASSRRAAVPAANTRPSARAPAAPRAQPPAPRRAAVAPKQQVQRGSNRAQHPRSQRPRQVR